MTDADMQYDIIREIVDQPMRNIEMGRELEYERILRIINEISAEIVTAVKAELAKSCSNLEHVKALNAQAELANHLYMRIALRTPS